jgi:hypothetical protein
LPSSACAGRWRPDSGQWQGSGSVKRLHPLTEARYHFFCEPDDPLFYLASQNEIKYHDQDNPYKSPNANAKEKICMPLDEPRNV